jgi:multidrug efflux system outer membrane protein
MVESNFLLGPVAGTILSLPLFDGGQRKAGVAQARAGYEQMPIIGRPLNAFREVENGLSDQRILDQQIQTQGQALVIPTCQSAFTFALS